MHKKSYIHLLPTTNPKTSDNSTFIDQELRTLESTIKKFNETCSKEVIHNKKLLCSSISPGQSRIKCGNIIEYFKFFYQNYIFDKHCTPIQIQKFYQLWNSFYDIAVGSLSHPQTHQIKDMDLIIKQLSGEQSEKIYLRAFLKPRP